jgi:hypothetical protein
MSSALPESEKVLAEVKRWFFANYLQGFIEVVERGGDASFITDYWGAPLWVSIDDNPVVLARTAEEVVAVISPIHARLKAAGYGTTAVPDWQITPVNARSAAIRVIWSRCRRDHSEIERCAVNFTVMKRDDGWRVLAIQQISDVTADTLDAIWSTDTGVGAPGAESMP